MQRSSSNPMMQVQGEIRHMGGSHVDQKNKQAESGQSEGRVPSPSPRLLGKISILGDQSRIHAVEACTSNSPQVMWSYAANSQQGVVTDAPIPEPAPEPSRDSDEKVGMGFDIKDALAKAEAAAQNAEKAIQAAKEMRERLRDDHQRRSSSQRQRVQQGLRVRSSSPAIGTPKSHHSSSTESGSPLVGRQSSIGRRASSGSYPVNLSGGVEGSPIGGRRAHSGSYPVNLNGGPIRSGSNHRPPTNPSDHYSPGSPASRLAGRPPMAVTPRGTPSVYDSPIPKPRNSPLPRQSTPRGSIPDYSPSSRSGTPRASTPERQLVANLTPRANISDRSPQSRFSSGGMQVSSRTAKRSSSAPQPVRQDVSVLTPRRAPSMQRMEKPIPAPLDTPTPRQSFREVLAKQSSQSNSPFRGVRQSSTPRIEEAPDDASHPRVKANILAWLESVLKPKPRPSERQKPQTLKGDGDAVAYSEIQFEKAIGAGSFGTVFKGVCRGDVVAIKQCKIGDPHDAEMLVMEIGYLQKLRHPRLVSFLGCCKKPPHVILLMEFMSGGSLYTLLFKQTKVKLRFVQKMMMAWQVSEGLVYLHDLSVVHRDLKTMNIVLDNDYNCKICDFGLTITLERTHMTVKNLQGSPRYMAPEQFEQNAKITEKVDIWQMGCLMLELFCLSVPFSTANGVQHIATELIVRRRPPATPHEADPRARTLIHASLKIQPQMRPNADGLVEALAGLCKHAGETDNVNVRRS